MDATQPPPLCHPEKEVPKEQPNRSPSATPLRQHAKRFKTMGSGGPRDVLRNPEVFL